MRVSCENDRQRQNLNKWAALKGWNRRSWACKGLQALRLMQPPAHSIDRKSGRICLRSGEYNQHMKRLRAAQEADAFDHLKMA
jgi:hypothetical protein